MNRVFFPYTMAACLLADCGANPYQVRGCQLSAPMWYGGGQHLRGILCLLADCGAIQLPDLLPEITASALSPSGAFFLTRHPTPALYRLTRSSRVRLAFRVAWRFSSAAPQHIAPQTHNQQVDQVIAGAFGMPMGPFRLNDLVGSDIGLHVGKNFVESFAERVRVRCMRVCLCVCVCRRGQRPARGQALC